MPFIRIIFGLDDDPEGNVRHIAEHGLTVDDVKCVLEAPTSRGFSRASGAPAVWGFTPDGRYIMVIYQEVADDAIYVITAFDVPEPYER